jgi:general secretion pathway protein A
MYYQYFGLNEAPFSIAVNPRYLFMSTRHRDALAHLLYGVGAGGGFILLTGEVGTGKTTINRCLLEQLPENTDIAIILNPALNALELLASACDELGIEYDARHHTLKTLTDKLQAFLLANHQRGRNTVLMIDEAQHLDFEVLEQIRLLTNLETNNEKLLQIILIGQPELAHMLERPELRQLNQRITARYNLGPLDRQETGAYIRHRLQVAGLPADRELFPRAVVNGIYRRSKGIPRLINLLCDRILLGTYGRNRNRADTAMLRVAAKEVMGEGSNGATGRYRLLTILGGVLMAVALAWLARAFFSGSELVSAAASGQEDAASTAARETVPQPAAAADPNAVPARSQGRGELASAGQLAAGRERGAQVGLPAPVQSTVATGQPWLLEPPMGIATLWSLTTARPQPGQLCAGEVTDAQRNDGPICVIHSAATWDELQRFSRPLLLHLVTPTRFAAVALLLRIEGRFALLWSAGEVVSVELATLAPLWDGAFSYLWRPPQGYTGPLVLWDQSPAVGTIAGLFAELDEQGKALTGSVFNRALQARVRLFQRQQGLSPDGAIGEQTILKLNEVMGIDPTSDEVLRRLGYSGDEAPAS